jgi:hypothetical protein
MNNINLRIENKIIIPIKKSGTFPSLPINEKTISMINKENMSKSDKFFNANQKERIEMLKYAVNKVGEFVKVLNKSGITDRLRFKILLSRSHNIGKEILEKYFGLTSNEFNSVCGDRLENYVKIGFSKDKNYICFNYADKFFFSSIDSQIHVDRRPKWTLQLRICRGIVFDLNTGEMVSFPYEKFFNTGEYLDGEIENLAKKFMEHDFVASEKIDGILIHVFYDKYSNNLRFATRGQFDEDDKGYIKTSINLTNKTGSYEKIKNNVKTNRFSLMFELIDPRYRVVVGYGKKSTLILHGIRNIESLELLRCDKTQEYAKEWGFEAPGVSQFNSFDELIYFQKNSKDDVEGFVLRFNDGSMIKVKTEAYFGKLKGLRALSYRTIGESLLNGADWNKFLYEVIKSEELFPFANKYRANLIKESDKFHNIISCFVEKLLDSTRWVIYGTKEKELALSEIAYEYNRMIRFKELDPEKVKIDDLRSAINNFIYYTIKKENKYGVIYNKKLIDLSIKSLSNDFSWMGNKLEEDFSRSILGSGGLVADGLGQNIGGAGLKQTISDKGRIFEMDKEEKEKREEQKK